MVSAALCVVRAMPLHLPVERVDGDLENYRKKFENKKKKKYIDIRIFKKTRLDSEGESFHGCRHSFASLSVRSFMRVWYALVRRTELRLVRQHLCSVCWADGAGGRICWSHTSCIFVILDPNKMFDVRGRVVKSMFAVIPFFFDHVHRKGLTNQMTNWIRLSIFWLGNAPLTRRSAWQRFIRN